MGIIERTPAETRRWQDVLSCYRRRLDDAKYLIDSLDRDRNSLTDAMDSGRLDVPLMEVQQLEELTRELRTWLVAIGGMLPGPGK